MKLQAKKMVSVFLMLCLLITPMFSVPASAADEDYGVMPALNNVLSCAANGSVNSSGKLTINYTYAGYQGITTKAVITTTLQKRFLGLFWKTVEIGGKDEWSFTVNDYRYSGSKNYQLPSEGKYRANITFKFYGSGGAADVIDSQMEFTY